MSIASSRASASTINTVTSARKITIANGRVSPLGMGASMVPKFNQPRGDWNVMMVESFGFVLYGVTSFKQSLAIWLNKSKPEAFTG